MATSIKYLSVTKDQHPILLKSYYQKKIGLDTMSVLHSMFGYCKKFDKVNQ